MTIQQTQRLALNTALHTSIRVLGADAGTLTRYLEEQAAENPALHVTPAPERAPGDWLPRWQAAFAAGDVPDTATPDASLLAHVMAQSTPLLRDACERRIALALTEALEPSGWLGRPLQVIAEEAAAPLPVVEAVLGRMQQIDPPGLFARNLAECLALQAEEAGRMDAVLRVMLQHLDLVGQGDFARLARLARTGEEEIRQRLRLIRSFDPKPGTRFAPMSARDLREPDLIVRPGDTGWEVAINRTALPTLRVEGRGPEAAAARAMVGMVERRNQTLLAVATEMLRLQTRALDLGRGHLTPMTMAQVAEATGLHQSTVSRVVAGTSADTPRGTIWLRALFSAAVAGQAAAAMRERLALLIAAEDPARPLSDGELADRLAPGGSLARRTVAKYRSDLSIPPASRRRRRPVRTRLADGPPA